MKLLFTDFPHQQAWELYQKTKPKSSLVVKTTNNGKYTPRSAVNQMTWYRFDETEHGYIEFAVDMTRFCPDLALLIVDYLQTKTPQFVNGFKLTLVHSVGLVPRHIDVNPTKVSCLNFGLFNSDKSETTWLDSDGIEHATAVKPGEVYLIDNKSLHSVQPLPGNEKVDRYIFSYITSVPYAQALKFWNFYTEEGKRR